MPSDKRNFARIPVPMDIEVRMDGADTEMMVLETLDISNGGAFIKVEPERCPQIGAHLQLKVKGSLGGQEPPTVRARVVRTTDEGMGVVYLDS